MNKGHRLGDVFRESFGPIVPESICVIPGIELEGSKSTGIKVLSRGRSGVARACLQDRDDAVPASQGLSGLARE